MGEDDGTKTMRVVEEEGRRKGRGGETSASKAQTLGTATEA